jgi:hypothetical protein
MNKLFLIVASHAEGVSNQWQFFAETKLDVLEYIINNCFEYEELFRGLYIDIEKERITPTILSDRIYNSWMREKDEDKYNIFETEIKNIPLVNSKKNSIFFSEINYEQIRKIIKIDRDYNKEFILPDIEYKFSNKEEMLFKKILDDNRYSLYESSDLLYYKVNVIYPILEMVNFKDKKLDDNHKISTFYGERIFANFDDINLGGSVDFLVGNKRNFPYKITPLFLVNQYINGITHVDMEFVLRLLVSMQQQDENENELSSMVGVSIHRDCWEFIKLNKKEGKYSFIVSENYYTSKEEDLKKIYQNLQAIKSLYCK